MEISKNRKLVLSQQTALRAALEGALPHEQSIALFLRHHAMLHSAVMSQSRLWSFEDVVFEGLTEEKARCLPPRAEHSVAWLIWHIARCEDITMNLLVAGSPQVLLSENWLDSLHISSRDTGNTLESAAMIDFNASIDVPALRAYRAAVGRRTSQVVTPLTPIQLRQRVDPARLQRVWDEGAVAPAASGIVAYWGGRTIAGLLLMPASRHLITHLNEALDVKRRLP
jgi:hypothetical protein